MVDAQEDLFRRILLSPACTLISNGGVLAACGPKRAASDLPVPLRCGAVESGLTDKSGTGFFAHTMRSVRQRQAEYLSIILAVSVAIH